MASDEPIRKNVAGQVMYRTLSPRTATGEFQANPTLATGDFKIAIDDGAPANLATLPAVDADFTKRVKFVFSQAETNGDHLTIIGSDASGAEWNDIEIEINTVADNFDAISTKIDTAQADLDTINTQVGTAGAGLTDLGGMSTAMKGEVGDAVWDEEDTGHQVVGTMGFRQNDTGEIANAVWGYTAAEPGQETPASTNTMLNKLGYLFKGWRNKKDQTATLWQLYNDDAATVDQKATVSDDGTTATKTEVESGP